MGITTNGLSICAAALVGSYWPDYGVPYMGVGIGSTAYTSGDTVLASEFGIDRNYVDTADLSTPEQVTIIANWSALNISGCVLKEFGVFTTGSTMLNRNVITGSLVFTGEEELQIQNTIKFQL